MQAGHGRTGVESGLTQALRFGQQVHPLNGAVPVESLVMGNLTTAQGAAAVIEEDRSW